jgi:hypothetical protein
MIVQIKNGWFVQTDGKSIERIILSVVQQKVFRKISKYPLTNAEKCGIMYLEKILNRKISK